MTAGWIILMAIAYIGGLFAIANWADRPRHDPLLQKYGGATYSLALAVYCTSWTYYGAVGSAVSSGWDYLPIYLGPVLLYLFGHRLLRKLLFVAKKHNVTSLTDFISARYGKRQAIAALTALLCLVVVVPYIALQLKAVTNSYQVLAGLPAEGSTAVWQDSALWSAVTMAIFAILFGTRKLHLTEQNRGVMAAIAFESVVKLGALLMLAGAVVYWVVPEPANLLQQFQQHSDAQAAAQFSLTSFLTKTLLAVTAVFLLPRQFHVTFVENTDPAHLHQARRWFVWYLLLVTIVVVPVAIAGIQLFPQQLAHADSFVLLIPASQGWDLLSALVFIGGFSAATSMIVIATLALGTMISNDVVMPALLRRQQLHRQQRDYSVLILRVRRLMILLVMALSWGYYRWFARNYELAETGLLAFALIIQLAPAVIGGLYWKRGHAWGVYAGVSVGFVLWFYCLMLPQLVSAGVMAATVLEQGAFGLGWLKPTALFGLELDALSHGVFWSLGLNTLAYVLMSLLHKADLNDRLQAVAFVKPNLPLPDDGKTLLRRNLVTSADILTLLERFVGAHRVRESLDEFEQRHGYRPSTDDVLQVQLLRHVERELAGVIGSSSAAAMVKAVLEGRSFAFEDVVTMFDDTREAIQFSRKILFSTLENLSQGVSVVDRDLQLVAWNKKYLEMFDYPAGMIRVGRAVADIVRFNAERGLCGPGAADEHVAKRISHLQNGTAHVFQRVRPDGSVIEIRGNPIPGGGFVTSFTDITEHVKAVQALAAAKEHLEQRVSERTAQISQMNSELLAEVELRRTTEQQLLQAKAEAEAANASKTRFLALASHDILQPLNAARLFAAALDDQQLNSKGRQMLGQLDNSLKATEELMATLLDIARLDEGKLEFPVSSVDLRAMLLQLADESQLLVAQKQLKLHVRAGHFQVSSHPTYLRRIVQNILSNAIKYTQSGKVLMGCRRRGDVVWIEVWDTGPGLAEQDLQQIFTDFYRVQATARGQQGVGLGLGVVQRMARSLGHPLEVRSVPGKGSCFRLAVPVIAEAAPQPVSGTDIQLPPIQAVAGAVSILCIDDDNSNLAALHQLLTQWQLGTVACLDDAEKVLQLQQSVDIVIADYQLGQPPDGLQLFIELKQRWPELRGILVSAAPDPGLPERAKAAGMLFLPKPIKAAALRAALNSLKLQGRGS